MKRLTETTKWQDPWFMELEPRFKLAWYYVLDNCDCAGILEPNIRLMRFLIGSDMDEGEVLDALGERVHVLDSGKWFVPKFVDFQQNTKKLNPQNNAHMGIIRRLEKEGVSTEELTSPTLAPSQPLVRGIGKGKGNSKGKGKGKEARPTNEEWMAHAKEIGYDTEDAQSAFDHYEANGWKVGGRATMKDWKAAARNCKRRSGKSTKPKQAELTDQPQSKQPSTWELNTKLTAVKDRIRQLKSKAPGDHCDLYDFLDESEREELGKLGKTKQNLERQLTQSAI